MAAPRLRSLPRNVTYVTRLLACVDGSVQNLQVSPGVGSVQLERTTPIREFFPWPGKRNYEGLYWSSTNRRHDLHAYFPALAAERHFRRHLAARDVLHDSLPMLIGRECASPVIIGASEIDRRRIEFGIDAIDALTYPEQVRIARLLCLPIFLCAATDPDTDAARRSSLVTRAAEKIIPARDDADPRRATNRVWTAITHLTARRRDARIYGVPMRDIYYNILRFIDRSQDN